MAGAPNLFAEKMLEESEGQTRGPVELVGDIFAKSGSLMREGWMQAMDLDFEPDRLSGIMSGEIVYSPREFRTDFEEGLGLGRNVESDLPEGVRTALDVGTDFIFNLDTLLFGGLGKGVSKLAPAAIDTLSKSAKFANSKAAKFILDQADPKTLGRMTTGGLFGAMAVQEEDEAGDVAVKMLSGAAMFGTIPKIFNMVALNGKKLSVTVDMYNKKFRPQTWDDAQRLFPDVPGGKTGYKDSVGIEDLIRMAEGKKAENQLIKNDYLKSLEKIEILPNGKRMTPTQLEQYDKIRMDLAEVTVKTRQRLEKSSKMGMAHADYTSKLKDAEDYLYIAKTKVDDGVETVMEAGLVERQAEVNRLSKIVGKLNNRAGIRTGIDEATKQAYLKAGQTRMHQDWLFKQPKLKQKLLNEINELTNSTVGEESLKYFENTNIDTNVLEAVRNFKKHNRAAINLYNKNTPHADMVGFDFYMPTKKDVDVIKAAELQKTAGQTQRAQEGFHKLNQGQIDFEGMTRGQIREVTAERYVQGFMTSQERTARALLRQFNDIPLDKKNFYEKMLGTYDTFMQGIVTGHLFAHWFWTSTNYTDGLVKAMVGVRKGGGTTMEGLKAAGQYGYEAAAGLGPVMPSWAKTAAESGLVSKIAGKSATVKKGQEWVVKVMDNMTPSMFRELLDVAHPIKGSGKAYFDNDMIELGKLTGVIDTDQVRSYIEHLDQFGGLRNFKGLSDIPEDGFFHKLADLAGHPLGKKVEGRMGKVTKASDDLVRGMMKFFQDTTGRIGSAIEMNGRLRTFENVTKAMIEAESKGAWKTFKKIGPVEAYKAGTIAGKGNKVIDIKHIMKQAAQVVDDTFFDYNKVTAFEQKVMKRIFPYYTFFTRDMAFWTDVMTDPRLVDASAKAWRTASIAGREPTKDEKKFLPDYMLEDGVRIAGRDGKTGKVILNKLPSSQKESMKNIFGLVDMLVHPISGKYGLPVANKLSPVHKLALEWGMNKDFFTGEAIKKDWKGKLKRRVFNDALVTSAIFNFIPGADVDVKYDKRGKMYVSDDESSFWISARKNLFPLRLPEVAVGAAKDLYTGKRSMSGVLKNYFTPLRTTEMSPGDLKYSAKMKEKSKIDRVKEEIRAEAIKARGLRR